MTWVTMVALQETVGDSSGRKFDSWSNVSYFYIGFLWDDEYLLDRGSLYGLELNERMFVALCMQPAMSSFRNLLMMGT